MSWLVGVFMYMYVESHRSKQQSSELFLPERTKIPALPLETVSINYEDLFIQTLLGHVILTRKRAPQIDCQRNHQEKNFLWYDKFQWITEVSPHYKFAPYEFAPTTTNSPPQI